MRLSVLFPVLASKPQEGYMCMTRNSQEVAQSDIPREVYTVYSETDTASHNPLLWELTSMRYTQ